ncbi:MAG: hypothetical protein ACYDBQ_05465 [Thermoplasmatota archaeon]
MAPKIHTVRIYPSGRISNLPPEALIGLNIRGQGRDVQMHIAPDGCLTLFPPDRYSFDADGHAVRRTSPTDER